MNGILKAGFFILCCVGCKESDIVGINPDNERPKETVPFNEFRSWGSPEIIEEVPDVRPNRAQPTSLSASGYNELNLLVRIPSDTLNSYTNIKIAYLRFDGTDWKLSANIEGWGWLFPSASITSVSMKTHFFWAGVTREQQQEWINRTISSTTLFHCVFEDGTCSNPIPIVSVNPGGTHLRFYSLGKDDRERIHTVVDIDGLSNHVILNDQGNVIEQNVLGTQTYPHIRLEQDTLHFVYMSGSSIRGRSNDLYYQSYIDGKWSQPVTTFTHPNRDGHFPTITIDGKGRYHHAFYTLEPDGTVHVMYNYSLDKGKTWSPPESIYTNYLSFARSPKMEVDIYGVLHLTWSHFGRVLSDSSTVGIESYYASRNDSSWSQVKLLYSELESISDAQMAVTQKGVVHIVQIGLDKKIYHGRFE